MAKEVKEEVKPEEVKIAEDIKENVPEETAKYKEDVDKVEALLRKSALGSVKMYEKKFNKTLTAEEKDFVCRIFITDFLLSSLMIAAM